MAHLYLSVKGGDQRMYYVKSCLLIYICRRDMVVAFLSLGNFISSPTQHQQLVLTFVPFPLFPLFHQPCLQSYTYGPDTTASYPFFKFNNFDCQGSRPRNYIECSNPSNSQVYVTCTYFQTRKLKNQFNKAGCKNTIKL